VTEKKKKNHSFISKSFLIFAKSNADYFRTEIFPFLKIRLLSLKRGVYGFSKELKRHKKKVVVNT
jgi:hypothetical protein